MAGVYVRSDVFREICFSTNSIQNYFCSIKYLKGVQFSRGCCAEGSRSQQNVRRLPSPGCTRSQAQARQSGRFVSWPVALVEPRDMRSILIAAAIATCCKWVFATPQYRSGATQRRAPLRERSFDAGPPLIELVALLAGRPGLRRASASYCPGRQPQPAARVLGTGTVGPHGTPPHACLSNATMMGRLPRPPPGSHHAADTLPWGSAPASYQNLLELFRNKDEVGLLKKP